MNVVFMGTPDYAVRILRHLKEAGFNIKAVFTQPDKPVGRKQILTPSEVKIYAQNELVGVPVFTPNTLKDEAVVAELKAFEPKFIVVAAYGKILPQSVLDVATCINLEPKQVGKFVYKQDLYSFDAKKPYFVLPISSATNENIDELKFALLELLKKEL